MSRSFRKPYATVTGTRSAADDKRVARRNWRHAQNNALRAPVNDWDEFLLPARYEASYNDVWSWGRDGRQWLHFPPVLDWDIHHCRGKKYSVSTDEERIQFDIEDFNHQLEYYERLKRK